MRQKNEADRYVRKQLYDELKPELSAEIDGKRFAEVDKKKREKITKEIEKAK